MPHSFGLAKFREGVIETFTNDFVLGKDIMMRGANEMRQRCERGHIQLLMYNASLVFVSCGRQASRDVQEHATGRFSTGEEARAVLDTRFMVEPALRRLRSARTAGL